MMGVTLWTREREQKAIDGWNQGLGCADVARSLGLTKNAVVSKLHRLNASGDPRFVRPYGSYKAKPRIWTDAELLDLLATKAVRRPDKWSWGQVAEYFNRPIKQCQAMMRKLKRDYAESEGK